MSHLLGLFIWLAFLLQDEDGSGQTHVYRSGQLMPSVPVSGYGGYANPRNRREDYLAIIGAIARVACNPCVAETDAGVDAVACSGFLCAKAKQAHPHFAGTLPA